MAAAGAAEARAEAACAGAAEDQRKRLEAKSALVGCAAALEQERSAGGALAASLQAR